MNDIEWEDASDAVSVSTVEIERLILQAAKSVDLCKAPFTFAWTGDTLVLRIVNDDDSEEFFDFKVRRYGFKGRKR